MVSLIYVINVFSSMCVYADARAAEYIGYNSDLSMNSLDPLLALPVRLLSM